ncbi:MAG: YbbR-like domain-containing protein [Deltaproteobacteria bacterium]|jgi:YbbR domain-containing protein|nr:YbbR-like domain-containing protein [Deltaproteobacteria bacterium]
MADKLLENWFLKLVSLAFAIVLWFFVMGERRLEVAHIIPLEYKNLPQDLILANEVPNSVAVRISGPRALLMNLSPSDISIAVDLENLPPGVTSFKRLEESLNIPSGLKVTRVSPSYVDVKLERVREKQVPVKAVLTGEPAAGFLLDRYNVEPAKVTVFGAESELKGISEVTTEGVDLTGVSESFSQTAAISYIGNYTDLKDVKTVEVQVILKPDPNYFPPETTDQGAPVNK